MQTLHQYRFSIDIKSVQDLAVVVPKVYCSYIYTPFGSHAPVYTYPPAEADGASLSTIPFNGSFAAYEFVMDQTHTFGYLKRFPLSIEFWAGEKFEPDVKLGEFTCDCDFTHPAVRDGESLKLKRADGSRIWVLDRWFTVQWSEEAAKRFPAETNHRQFAAQIRVVLSLEDFHPISDGSQSKSAVDDLAATTAAITPQSDQLDANVISVEDSSHPNVSLEIKLAGEAENRGECGEEEDFFAADNNNETALKPSNSMELSDTEIIWIRNQQLEYMQRLKSDRLALMNGIKEAWLKRMESAEKDTLRTVESLDADINSVLAFEKDLKPRSQRLKILEDDLMERSNLLERNHSQRMAEVEAISHRYRSELEHQLRLAKGRSSTLQKNVSYIHSQLETLLQNVSMIENEFKEIANDSNQTLRSTVCDFKPTPLDIEAFQLEQALLDLRRKHQSQLNHKRKLKDQWSETLAKIADERQKYDQHLQLRNHTEREKLDKIRMRQLLSEEKLLLPTERRLISEIRDRLYQMKQQVV